MAFNRDRNSRGGDRGGFRSRPSFGDRPRFNDRGDRGRLDLHKAICDNCGKECEVPFRPTQGKPVFCSNCFENKRGGSDSRKYDGRNYERSEQRPFFEQPNYNTQLEALNSKLDNILKLLENKKTEKKTKLKETTST